MRQGGNACSVVVVIGLLEKAVEDEDGNGNRVSMTEDGVVGDEVAEVMGTEEGAEVGVEVGVTLGDVVAARGLCMKRKKKKRKRKK